MGSTTHLIDSPHRLGEHAVVLGAGIAGLLAARVLSEFYDSVSVVERDRLPDYPCHRRGIPQGRHAHNFYSRGLQVLGELFPGLLDDLAKAGAVVVDDGELSHFYVRLGRYELKSAGTFADPAALTLHMASRPFMEYQLRRRVKALPNVTFLDGHDVSELLTTGDIVNRVRIIRRYNGFLTPLDADLVVDAMGRAARTPALLIGIGVIAVSLPLLWWRFRRDDRGALTGMAWSMLIVVLFVPAALPWYYSWPLAVTSPLAQSRRSIAAIGGLSTWAMVIFKPDGSHGMYSWLHFSMATVAALIAWRALYRAPKAPADQAEEPLAA